MRLIAKKGKRKKTDTKYFFLVVVVKCYVEMIVEKKKPITIPLSPWSKTALLNHKQSPSIFMHENRFSYVEQRMLGYVRKLRIFP